VFNVAGKDLAINGYTLPSATDVLPIRLSNLVINTAYEIKLDAAQFSGNGLQAYLRDNVLNTKTLLVGSNNSISFTTTSVDVASYTNRYSVVFGAGILPVSDIKLTATAQASDVQVAWTVVGESNVASYTVQHSVDGTSFSSIATVAANSNAYYSVIDSKAVAGTNFYRIKVSSNDGTVSYSNVVELTTNNSPLTTIAAYPNPLIGAKLNVALNHLDAGKYSITVYNVLGAKVVEKSITHVGGNAVEQLSINSHLAAGVYTVRVSDANGVSYQSQIEVK
ncbi:MAG: T9SS type A sorting domain-containing protein, partial [Alphaproteobacteria bacterium]